MQTQAATIPASPLWKVYGHVNIPQRSMFVPRALYKSRGSEIQPATLSD